jgi:hypothetical protein
MKYRYRAIVLVYCQSGQRKEKQKIAVIHATNLKTKNKKL